MPVTVNRNLEHGIRQSISWLLQVRRLSTKNGAVLSCLNGHARTQLPNRIFTQGLHLFCWARFRHTVDLTCVLDKLNLLVPTTVKEGLRTQ